MSAVSFSAGDGAIWVLRVLTAVITAVLMGFCGILTQFFWWVPLPVGVIMARLYLPSLVHSIYGEISERGIYVRYGVLWQRESWVPPEALCTVEAWVPPLHRLFGCQTVVLRFAGGCVLLPLVDKKQAHYLTAHLEDL